MIRRALPVACLVLVALWPGTALAQPETARDLHEQVVLSGDVVVPRGKAAGEVVVFTGSVTVGGVVDGDVVVLQGPVVIAGQVSGDVVALDGTVKLQETAQVGGDVLGGGVVTRVDGAQVGGVVRQHVRFTLAGSLEVLGALVASAAMAVSTLFALLVLVLLAPRGAERVAGAALTAPLASTGWGLLLTIGLPVLGVATAATILGLPFGLALLLALGLLWLVGQAWATWIAGRLVVREPHAKAGALFAGWGIGAVLGLVPYLNVAWWTLGSVFGLGAMTVAVWRARGTKGRHRVGGVTVPEEPLEPAPAPAPPHEEPSTHPPETPLADD